MKLNLRSVISGAAVLAVAGGILAATAGTAFAATPAWEPDPNALGSLTLYNSSGTVVTSGTNLNHLFDYAEASTADPDGPSTKATLTFANPSPGVPTGDWFVGQASLSTTYPNTSAPAPLNTATNPVVTLGATDADLAAYIPTATANTEAGYENVYQIRLITSGGTGGGTGSANYWEVDIQVNPTAGTWAEIYPTAGTLPQGPTTTTVSATPSTVAAGTATSLTASETPVTPGTFTFSNGSTTIGTVSSTTGSATQSYSPPTAGTDTITATFAPTDTTDFAGSTGTTTLTVTPPATPTTTSLSVSYTNTSAPVSVSSTVEAAGSPIDAGTVSWYDNGSSTPLNSSPVTPNASGVATDSFTLAAGGHSIVAVFTPTSTATYEPSSSAPQAFDLQAPLTGACSQTGSQCTAVSSIEATIPVGTLVISTPYTPANPLNLGTMALNSSLTEYSATAPFSGVTVVDTRAGDLPWTVSALASNLTDGGSNLGSTICGQNVGLTGLVNTPGAGFAGTVTLTNNSPASPVVAPTTPGACPTTAGGLVGAGATAVTVAAANAGLGTDVVSGTLDLNAPTSTEPGLFTGTITFTVG
jgi:hypothetical protein